MSATERVAEYLKALQNGRYTGKDFIDALWDRDAGVVELLVTDLNEVLKMARHYEDLRDS